MIDTQGTGAILEFDVEGSAFSLHFPTANDADRFKRGVVTGALAASLAIGGVVGVATVASHSGTAAVPASVPGAMTLDEKRVHALSVTAAQLAASDSTDPDGYPASAPAQAAPPKTMTLDEKRVHALSVTAAQLAAWDADPDAYPTSTEEHHVEGAGR